MRQRDWELLRQLRAGFLSAKEGLADYWDSPQTLELYDRFFAARIGWKWDAILRNLTAQGWVPPDGRVIDWGCGTGIAARSWLGFFPTTQQVELWDRSAKARQFAAGKIAVKTQPFDPSRPSRGTYLISHVLNELPAAALDSLLATLRQNAAAVLWVEPGTHEISRRLIEVRERLRADFSIVTPCPQEGICGMLAPGNERHWCHQFAVPPPYVFQDAEWSAFAREMEIDIRTVPYSHLVLDRRPAVAGNAEYRIGHPRIYKGHARLLVCAPEGVAEKTIQKRDDPEYFRQLKKG